jgi:DNA polymerase-1
MRENVLAFRDRQEIVRKLVTLRKDVPIEFNLADASTEAFDPAAAAGILDELGLRRLLERVGAETRGGETRKREDEGSKREKVEVSKGRNDRPEKNATEGTLFESDAIEPAPDAAGAAGAGLLIESKGPAGAYELADTDEALARLAASLGESGDFALDTETTGLKPAYADLVGMSFSTAAETGFYVPIRGVGRTVPLEAVAKHLGPILADPNVRKCGQNIKYDLVVLRAAGIDVAGVDFDSMLASFLLDSTRRSHGIDALSLDFFGHRKISTEEMIGRRGKEQLRFDELPTEKVCEYACEDADFAFRLRGTLEKRLRAEPELDGLFREVEMPLVEVLAEMEHRGVAIDVELLGRISGQMAGRLSELERDIHRQAGRPFNINSTQQLATILFDERKLRVVKRTKTLRSTDAEVLETLAAETGDPIVTLLLEYRELSKLKGTYVDALPELVHPRTRRIHPIFNQTGAVTGRLSCNDPNLQNIPIRSEVGAQIRRAFVPGAKDQVLLKADYSQIELRVLAHFCGDAALSAAFREDRDIHAFVASQIHGVPLGAVSDAQRAQAKTVNFGIIYGQSAFGLARQTGMTQTEAKAFIERYFARYPKIRGFLDQCIAHARRHGYVRTLLGRRRAIPDIHSRNQTARNAAERLAVNTVVQGTAADLIKRAMVNIHRRIKKEDRPSRMLIQVHDELVFEVPKSAVDAEAAMIVEEMSGALALDVPIKVDVGWGPNWLEAS